MPIQTSESKFELEPYGFKQMIFFFSVITLISLASIVAGILLSEFQESWFLYIVGGIGFVIGCVLFGIRYQKMKTGALEAITMNVEGIKKHSKKAGTIKFMSWADDLHHSVAMEDVTTDDDISVEVPSVILITNSSNNENMEIRLEKYATIFVRSERIIQEFEQAFKKFKKQYKKLNK